MKCYKNMLLESLTETMMPYEIVKSVKRNGISARSNFLIGFRDETWESILAQRIC